MAPGSELAADVFVTDRDSLVSSGTVGTARTVCNVSGEFCAAERDDDVDTFSRATGAVGLALSWEGSFVLGRNSVTLLSFLRGLSTLDPWRASQRHSFHCVDHMFVAALFLRPANTSLEEDTKFCSKHMFVLSARHDQATTHDATRRRLCAASIPSPALRCCFQLPAKGSFH